MATTTADSISPRSSAFATDNGFRRNLSSPAWSQIVRGAESELLPVPMQVSVASLIHDQEQITNDSDWSAVESSCLNVSSPAEIQFQSENSDNVNNDGSGKKQVWNKPAIEVGLSPVMGAVSWPALSEATKASQKSSVASDSLKPQGPVIPSPPPKTVMSNANMSPNHKNRHKSGKRGGAGGGGIGPTNGGGIFPQPPVLTPPPLDLNGNQAPLIVIPDTSPKDGSRKSNNNNWEGGSRGIVSPQPHIGNENPQHRAPLFRRPHPRGDGSYANSYGGRREHDRGNQDWNPHRPPFNARDVHMNQHRVIPRPFIRPPPPPPAAAPFIGPPSSMRPFGSPMGFPDMASPVYYVPAPPHESIRGVPFVHAAPSSMFFHAVDPQLHAELVKQIDYYFSSDNLCKDTYLRQNMDEQGWVPISLIASFNRVKLLTNNIQFVLDAVRSSTVVEVQGDRIRKRHDWMIWPLPKASPAPGPQSTSIPDCDQLANRIQNIRVEEAKATNQGTPSLVDRHTGAAVLSRSSSEELNKPLSYGQGRQQGFDHAGSSTRS